MRVTVTEEMLSYTLELATTEFNRQHDVIRECQKWTISYGDTMENGEMLKFADARYVAQMKAAEAEELVMWAAEKLSCQGATREYLRDVKNDTHRDWEARKADREAVAKKRKG